MSRYYKVKSMSGDDTPLTPEEAAQVASEQSDAAEDAILNAKLQTGGTLGSPLPLILIGGAIWYFFIKK